MTSGCLHIIRNTPSLHALRFWSTRALNVYLPTPPTDVQCASLASALPFHKSDFHIRLVCVACCRDLPTKHSGIFPFDPVSAPFPEARQTLRSE